MKIPKILIAGLGNPGEKYLYTRHNAGFLFLDRFQEEYFPTSKWKHQYSGYFIRKELQIEENIKFEVLLLKPQTFMNLSGNSLQDCIKEENLSIKNVLVIHDEIELPFGEVRFKEGGGHLGHNGLRDIIQKCGGDFYRIRIGVGRPENSISVSEYLLSNFLQSELQNWDLVYAKGKELLFENFFKKFSITIK